MTTDKILVISRGAGFLSDALENNLKEVGFETKFAEPVVRCIEAGRADCDVVLLDYDMPVTQGPQLMEMIRTEFDASEIPIIFVTGKSDRASIMNVVPLKPQGYLLKTMCKEDIVDAVDNFFMGHKWDNIN